MAGELLPLMAFKTKRGEKEEKEKVYLPPPLAHFGEKKQELMRKNRSRVRSPSSNRNVDGFFISFCIGANFTMFFFINHHQNLSFCSGKRRERKNSFPFKDPIAIAISHHRLTD